MKFTLPGCFSRVNKLIEYCSIIDEMNWDMLLQLGLYKFYQPLFSVFYVSNFLAIGCELFVLYLVPSDFVM